VAVVEADEEVEESEMVEVWVTWTTVGSVVREEWEDEATVRGLVVDEEAMGMAVETVAEETF